MKKFKYAEILNKSVVNKHTYTAYTDLIDFNVNICYICFTTYLSIYATTYVYIYINFDAFQNNSQKSSFIFCL